MIPMSVRFHPDRDEVIFPDVEPGEAAEGEIVEIVCVANGVADRKGGPDKPSVVLRIAAAEITVAALTTARLFITAAKMIEAKYPDLMKEPD